MCQTAYPGHTNTRSGNRHENELVLQHFLKRVGQETFTSQYFETEYVISKNTVKTF